MLDSIFGIRPNNIELYKLALLHRSASLHLDDGTPINNERLEFLGDAILEAIVSDYLFIEFPDRDEGFLTQIRQRIVSRVSLNELSCEMGLAQHVIRNGTRGNVRQNLYGDALEAMIGAIYLDKGYDYTNRLLINRVFRKYLDLDRIVAVEIDFKSRLIEWCQKSRRAITFHTSTRSGPASGNPAFISRVVIDGIQMGSGEGPSKKEAEQHAAYMLSALVMSDDGSDQLIEMLESDDIAGFPNGKRGGYADETPDIDRLHDIAVNGGTDGSGD